MCRDWALQRVVQEAGEQSKGGCVRALSTYIYSVLVVKPSMENLRIIFLLESLGCKEVKLCPLVLRK